MNWKTTMMALAVASPAGAAVVPAIEYYHAGFDHYFMTASAAEASILDAGTTIKGWARTGKTFSVDDTSGSPVCRFFSTSFAPKSSHFYTANVAECATVKANPNWAYESVAFNVTLPSASGTCATGSKVYRLYNNGQGGAPNHRYTTETAVVNSMKAQGWIPEGLGEGVAFCTTASAPPTSAYTLAFRLVGGVWRMSYTFGIAYVDQLRFTNVFANTGTSSVQFPYFIEGTGPFNRYLLATYAPADDVYVGLWQFSSGAYNGYAFKLTGANSATGCYDYDANLDNLFDNCSPMTGLRTASAVEGGQSSRSEADEFSLKEYFK